MLDQGTEQSTFSFPFSHGIRHRTNNSGTRVASKKSSPKNHNNRHELNDVDLQLGTKSKLEDESGICSPPLWSSSPRMNPQQRRNYYRCLSPTSKTQAIARGQRELMEMVKNMPESNYELSLKDLVEHSKVEVGEEKKENKKESVSGKRVNKKGSHSHVKRNGKIESGGFYLKLVFPVTTLGGKKNKKKKESLLANSNSSKVSPRNSVSDGFGKSVDKEWWKKKSLSGSVAESESGLSSINSGSMKSSGSSSTNSSRSNSRHEISASSCWPFIRRPESLSQK